MQKRFDNVLNKQGNALQGIRVTVKDYPAGTLASIYAANGSDLIGGSYVTTDALGYYEYYAADGRYIEEISGPGIETEIIQDILIEDAVSDLASSSGSSLVGFIQSGTGATERTVEAELREHWVSVKQFGAVGDGATLDDTAIDRAYTATPVGGTLFFPLAPSGYLISTTKTIAKKIRLVFDGGAGVGDGDLPGAYLLKKDTMAADGLVITAKGVIIENGGVVGEVGNTGNGITVKANNVHLIRPSAIRNGGEGIRIGEDSGGNANTFYLEKPVCSFNGANGIYIHNDIVNANAGVIVLPSCQGNGEDGIKLGTTRWNTIIGALTQGNTGWGIHCATGCIRNTFIAGDTDELNVAGNILIDSGADANHFLGTDYTPASLTDNGTANVFIGQRGMKIPVTLTVSGNAITTGSTTALSLDTAGGTQAKIVEKASAVNFWNLQGGALGEAVTLFGNGSDTNIALAISSKGTGAINFYTNTVNNQQFAVLHTASANRRITVTGSNGGNPTLGVTAGDLGISSSVRMAGSMKLAQGAVVASANDMTLGADGNYFQISGTTQINRIVNSNWAGGAEVTLKFNGVLTVKHGQASSGTTRGLVLNGAVDFVTAAGNLLTLIYDSTDNVWYEKSRKV